ncbi:hypothetical protein H072_300 [Dactylellina haptotyla CBS 200.50]|uniref:NADP-dependent oxidoreductase domain-containing protein n=1 Tax=Dactylellina haptotyla (strain CBS 200.50) TaxID=1284197 RepID=S8ASJ7_DACHA|nr:hypothetical protein H072_300 [Dactylellina haptotyla CBS 200.50]
MAQSKSELPIILGTMTFGENSRITDINECKRLIDIFKSYGHNELDTARVYNEGTSEEYLGKIGTEGLIIATKLYPNAKPGQDNSNAISHTPESIQKHVSASMAALKLSTVDLWYLHAPDHTTDITITLPAVNDLYKAGIFKSLGISNYKSWEVARMCEIARENNFPLPKVYQGVYNVIHREVEPELFACLRHYGIAFYAYNPLAGGFFTATGPKSVDGGVDTGTRFDDSKVQGQMYRKRYWKDSYFKARDIIEAVAEKNGLTLVEVALRWMNHHSLLRRENGDKIIIGASSEKHLRENCEDLEKGPLPDDVVEVCNQAWNIVKPDCEVYWR